MAKTLPMPPGKTLALPAQPRAPQPTSRHVVANQETMEKAFGLLKTRQESLASDFNAQIRERRESPFVGETVLYRMQEGPSVGEQRPALVVLIHDSEGDTTRCALKVICSPDHDGVGVIDEPNVPYGQGLGEWLPVDPRIPMKDPELEDRVPVGESLDG